MYGRSQQSIKAFEHSLTAMFIVVAVFCFGGCDPDWPSAHSTCEVHGKLLLEGEPLANAKVVFIPQQVNSSENIYKIASGETDELGEFILKVDSREPKQIRHDRYRVIISKLENDKESLHSSYNTNTVLTHKVQTQEAFDRPKFELTKTGSL